MGNKNLHNSNYHSNSHYSRGHSRNIRFHTHIRDGDDGGNVYGDRGGHDVRDGGGRDVRDVLQSVRLRYLYPQLKSLHLLQKVSKPLQQKEPNTAVCFLS